MSVQACHLRFLSCLFALVAGAANADLIGHWTFDDQTPEDISGFGHDGTLAGGTMPSYVADQPPILGNNGFSLSFPGGDAHVLVPHAPSLDITNAITIAAWVKTEADGWDGILAKSPSDGSAANHAGNYELRVENGSRSLTFLHQQGGQDDTVPYLSPPVPDRTWSHVAVTAVNGGDVNFYVNGSLTSTQALAGPFGSPNTSPLYIGSRADLFTTLNGQLDDVRLYDEVLDAEDIQFLAGGELESYPKIDVLGARASTEFTPDGRTALNAVNGAGLLGMEHSISPAGTMWLTAENDPAPELIVDLGQVHAIDELRLWNYNEAANPTCCLDRGVKTFDVYVSSTANRDAQLALEGATLSRAPGEFSDFSEVIDLNGAMGRFVHIRSTSNHGDPSFTGLSEVNVQGTVVEGAGPIPVVEVTASSELVGAFDRVAAHLTDGSGLGAFDSHALVPDGNMWLSNGTFAEPFDTEPEVVFDLGEVKEIDSVKIWNYNELCCDRDDELLGRGVKEFDILIAGEDGEFALLLDELELDRAQGETDVDFSESIDLFGVPARFIKFDIRSNHNGLNFDVGGDDGLANFAGLSEVQFFEKVSSSLACDFDASGECDIADLDGLLYDGINDQDLAYDIDQSGTVDVADVELFLDTAGKANVGEAYVFGDADLDGDVDSVDLNAIGVNWQSVNASSWAQGDFDGDGDVDSVNLNSVGVNWQHGVPARATVPEPHGYSVYLVVLLGIMILRRR